MSYRVRLIQGQCGLTLFLQPDLDPSCAECNITLDFNFVSALSCAVYVHQSSSCVSFQSAPFFTVNGVTYKSPTIPVLLQILIGSFTAQDLMPQGSVYTLPRNKTIQINMPGGVLGIPHPLHLHGVGIPHTCRPSAANSTSL